MADVLTQAPLAAHVGPHVRPRTSYHESSLPRITASTIRSLPSRNKARLADIACNQYADGVPVTPPPFRMPLNHDQDDRGEPSDVDLVRSSSPEGPHAGDHVVMPVLFSRTGCHSRAAYSRVYQDKQLPAAPADETTTSSCHDNETTPRQSKYDDLADALTRDPPRLSSPTPPPVPPKLDRGHVSKTRAVSILEPSELSHGSTHEDNYDALDYTVSDPGHDSIPPAGTSVTGSGRVPRRKTFSSRPTRHSAGACYSYPSRLSWADMASLPIYRNSFSTDGHRQMASSPTSMSAFSESSSYPSHLARRKLRKPRPVSAVSSLPCGPFASSSSASPRSGSTINLFRALSHKSVSASHEAAQPSPPSSPRNTISFFRRCTSDHGHDDSATLSSSTRVSRPPVLPRQSESGSAQSHSHSSSTSHSTTFSSVPSDHSTPATTPEASSPVYSPLFGPPASQCVSGAAAAHNAKQDVAPQLIGGIGGGGGGRKLKKRRPSQSAPGTSEASSSSGTPDFPGLRSWRTQARQASSPPTTTQNVYLPPISPVSPFGLDIPKEYTSGRRPAFPPPPKRKRSTSALAQLAWTGLSSSELAALTSRLHIQRTSPEHTFQGKQAYEDGSLGTFDPYVEGLYARGGNPKRVDVNALEEEEENEMEDTHREAGGSALGHAVTSRLSTMKRMVSPRIDTPAPPSPTTPKPRANSVYANGSNLLSSGPRAPQHARKSASFLETDPMAMRRWTLAMADVPDEVLVQELDKLRKGAVARKAHAKSRTPAQSDSGHTVESTYSVSPTSPWRPGVHFRLGSDSDSEDEGDGEEEDEALDGFENDADEEEWKAARRALLCCRELVRTERSYQARLRELINAQSSHPFFSLLLSYVPALLRASEALLVRLVDDPSAWGVSAAFIGCEEELEAAMVAWCGVVGNFYIDGDEKYKRGRRRRKSGDEFVNPPGPTELRGFSARSPSQSGIVGMAKTAENRRLSLFSPSEGGMFTAALGTGLAFGLSSPSTLDSKGHGSMASIGKDHGPTGTLTRTLSAWKRKSMPSSLSNLPNSMGLPPSPSSAHGHGKEKLLTLRDLAIQPTQRVMRYVLQYKDLLAHTPLTSPSRGLVERALESAVRIAKKCDRAQGNSAFLR